MFYELWDVEDGNIVNTYDTEADALAAVRALLDLNGREYARALSLMFEDDDETTTLVAKGLALAERARATLPASQRPKAS
jgi:hypothetical protein